MPVKLYLDNWISEKIGLEQEDLLTREKIERYQLVKLRETVAYAKANSPFYQKLWKNLSEEDIKKLKDIEKFPFVKPDDVIKQGEKLVCLPENEREKMGVLITGGFTGEPKQIYFTEEDQQLSIDYFKISTQYVAKPGDRVLVLYDYKKPGSLGNLLEVGMDRRDVEVVQCGHLQYEADYKKAIQLLQNQKISCVIGMAGEVSKLAKKTIKSRVAESIQDTIESVILSGEYVSVENTELIGEAWDCRVYEHYGCTEMGYGCAVLCRPNAGKGMAYPGYHYREADLYIEIINPHTGIPVADGEYGEIVFTTLTRKGMPFIRYKTGDVSRWIDGPCKCGSILKRLDKVRKIKYAAI